MIITPVYRIEGVGIFDTREAAEKHIQRHELIKRMTQTSSANSVDEVVEWILDHYKLIPIKPEVRSAP